MRNVHVPKFFLTSFTSRSATAIALYLTLHLLTGGLITTAYATGVRSVTHSVIASAFPHVDFQTAHQNNAVLGSTVRYESGLAEPFVVMASNHNAMRLWINTSADSLVTSSDFVADIRSPRAP